MRISKKVHSQSAIFKKAPISAEAQIGASRGDGNEKMIDVNVKVKLDKNGNFSKAWSIDSKGNKSPLNIFAPEKKK